MARQYYQFIHDKSICAQGSDDEYTTRWLLTCNNRVITSISREEVEKSLSWINISDNAKKDTDSIR